eukprot:m.48874 g.48874  ORF g.48874 m.48874 type:complete len:233 (-) comp12767_c0_seq1:223-921(-)
MATQTAAGDHKAMMEIKTRDGNERCIDCGTVDATWAAVNMGIVLCLTCAGVHRSLGVHKSKVRSMVLDKLSSVDMTMMMSGGNKTFKDFMTERSAWDQPVWDRYSSPEAELYRLRLQAIVDGQPQPAALTDGQLRAIEVNNAAELQKKGEKKEKPQWTPDKEAASCEDCGVGFTMVKRRHHCRRCGKCVCSNCAPKKNSRPIPEWNIRDPVRHCVRCYKSPLLKNKDKGESA